MKIKRNLISSKIPPDFDDWCNNMVKQIESQSGLKVSKQDIMRQIPKKITIKRGRLDWRIF